MGVNAIVGARCQLLNTRENDAPSRTLNTGMKIIAKVALASLAGSPSRLRGRRSEAHLHPQWVAGGDHAPYFYAQKMGLYKQAGIDVDFETGRGSAASAQKVGAGQSPLGLSDMAGRCCSAARAPTMSG